MAPIHEPLFYTNPTGGFDTVFASSFFFALLLSLPVIVYNFLKFIEPAVDSANASEMLKIVIASAALGTLGFLFAYFFSLPSTFTFLQRFQTTQLKSLITVHEYFSFVTRYLLAFALIFQLPIVLFIINKIRPLSVKGLASKQLYVLIVSLIFAAIITPTSDVINQLFIAVPLLLLYESAILVVWISGIVKKSKLQEKTVEEYQTKASKIRAGRFQRFARIKGRFFNK